MLEMVLDTLDGLAPEIAALYTKRDTKFELQVKGAKSEIDIQKLVKAANDERDISKELKRKLGAWGDLDPEVVRPLLDKVPEMQATIEAGAKKLDEKQLEAVVNGRVTPVQRALEKALNDLKERDTQVTEFKAKDTRRTIFDAVRKYATDTKANPEAYGSDMGGLMLLAKEVFTVDAAGQVVVKEGAPGMVHGTHIKDAFAEVQKSYGYFWPSSQGGGASGGAGGPGAPKGNPFKTNDISARTQFVAQFPDKVPAMLADAGLENTWDTYKGK